MSLIIVYVDEDKGQHRDFMNKFRENIRSGEVDCKCILPLENIDEAVSEILSYHPDVLVCDWQLNANKEYLKYEIDYTGSELIEKFLDVRKGFPVYVNSALIRECVGDDKTNDINNVFSKSDKDWQENENSQDLSIVERIKIQSVKYRKRLDDYEKELSELIKKRNTTSSLTVYEEERIVELDGFLESSIDNRSGLAKDLKVVTNKNRLDQLIKNTEEILKKVEESESR